MDIKCRVIQKVTKSMFTIQFDESTDILHNGTLLFHVRYIDYDDDVKED